VNRPFYPAGKLPAVPGWLGRSVEHTASPGRIREEQNKVTSHTIITPTKYTLLLLKAPDITICTFCPIFCPYMFQPAWVIFRGLNASAWLKLLLITIY
jgi:hypothetical protein